MKARFVNEKVGFERGGPDAMKKALFGPAIGSLYKWGSKFPYIVMLVERGDNNKEGIFQQIGLFQGGGGKKTRYRNYSPQNRERYTIPYDVVRPIPQRLWKDIEIETNRDQYEWGTYWERFKEETGIDPILPIYESIGFERGGTPDEIKRRILGDQGKLMKCRFSKHQNMVYMKGFNNQWHEVGLFMVDPGRDGRKNFHFFPKNWHILSKEEAEWTNIAPLSKWERNKYIEAIQRPADKEILRKINQELNITPYLPAMNEEISFKRGKTDREIKRDITGLGFLPGEIVVRDKIGKNKANEYVKELYVYVKYQPEGILAPHKVYTFGNIDRRTNEPSFIHNTQNLSGQGNIQNNTFRNANEEETESINQALESGKYDRYIEECKKKTGLDPFV